MDEDVKSIAMRLLDYCRANDWAGYDPYDALNSKVISSLPFLDSRLPRLALTQILKRSAINVRSLLLVPKTQNPKVLGILMSALANLSQAGVNAEEDCTPQLLERLVALRSEGSSYWCWGYNFPWQTRRILVPTYAPNVICTIFVANGLLDVFEQRHEEGYFKMALSAAEYILNDLYWNSGGGACGVYYPRPNYDNKVHNASLLAAALFCRVYKHTGREMFLAAALALTRYTVAKQHQDGSWDYGESPTQKWIDNFHTGFNLSALHSIARTLASSEFDDSLLRGLRFYRSHFFHQDGAVRYFHDRPYPIDAHCVGQSITTMIDLKDLDPTNVQLARTVFEWAKNHLWSEKEGYFYYRVYRFFTIKTSYMRWSQAPMILALSKLLEESSLPASKLQPPALSETSQC